ncbi:hypothetical protein FTUN_2234 [Frigoriglobus tundricola]|uniref:Uncharacterized protein n=1 Tax=Frigoriglobus tundricola TaxID=2774151 RepID=A0A6M5YP08_9BACT|nr:hypothetical protein FTUN_2234 [Frigoriglobus tundricola]
MANSAGIFWALTLRSAKSERIKNRHSVFSSADTVVARTTAGVA